MINIPVVVDAGLDHTLRAIEKELSGKNVELIKRYDKES